MSAKIQRLLNECVKMGDLETFLFLAKHDKVCVGKTLLAASSSNDWSLVRYVFGEMAQLRHPLPESPNRKSIFKRSVPLAKQDIYWLAMLRKLTQASPLEHVKNFDTARLIVKQWQSHEDKEMNLEELSIMARVYSMGNCKRELDALSTAHAETAEWLSTLTLAYAEIGCCVEAYSHYQNLRKSFPLFVDPSMSDRLVELFVSNKKLELARKIAFDGLVNQKIMDRSLTRHLGESFSFFNQSPMPLSFLCLSPKQDVMLSMKVMLNLFILPMRDDMEKFSANLEDSQLEFFFAELFFLGYPMTPSLYNRYMDLYELKAVRDRSNRNLFNQFEKMERRFLSGGKDHTESTLRKTFHAFLKEPLAYQNGMRFNPIYFIFQKLRLLCKATRQDYIDFFIKCKQDNVLAARAVGIVQYQMVQDNVPLDATLAGHLIDCAKIIHSQEAIAQLARFQNK